LVIGHWLFAIGYWSGLKALKNVVKLLLFIPTS
jgi:hypothetical protein